MVPKHIRPEQLRGKVTDIHAHLGVSIKAYANLEFPYCQSLEGLYYRQRMSGVDFGVVFPYSPELYFDLYTAASEGRLVPAAQPLSSAPYARENRLVFNELFLYCPEYRDRYLPFVSMDPVREVAGQLRALHELEQEFPIYGIKIVPIACQSKITGLLEEGMPLLEFACERDLPLLIHVTTHKDEQYSQLADTFRVVERHPELRFCLAHCLGFSREFLERADGMPNVWVDTAALKIQVQAAYENNPIMAGPGERPDWDYSDHAEVMRALMDCYPRTIVWGSDSPAYSYISRRMQAPGVYTEFRLKANYEDEKAALDGLDPALRERASSINSMAFLFGASRRSDD